ncbi:lytic transglycosylase domain-containing protein [Povalibacter sp.]|uniref:lytic transglycosylase domain-containing protein n=1 Tax=Povalibacter sp. TaxID=1962978 RepID=UPI002F4111A1
MPVDSFISRRSVVAVLAVFSFAASALAAEDPLRGVRVEFTQAYARASQPGAAPADSENLRTYPLYPYLQAARIRQALKTPGASLESVDERTATFLAYYNDEPVARGLRRAWLESLATRQQWEPFLANYREAVAGDALRCQSFVARLQMGRTEGLAREVAAQWLTPQSLPECDAPFAWLRTQNALPDSLIEQRARLALAKGTTSFARQIIAQLPAAKAAPLQQWASILDNPQRGIDALITSPQTPVEPDALLAGWSQLARKDRIGALSRFNLLVKARKLDDAAASPYALKLALPLSHDRDPAALGYFAMVRSADFDETAREWHVRAALWAEDWKQVSTIVANMPDEQRQLVRWRYWAARAAEEQDNRALAEQLYESVIADDNYYSVMASARLDRAVKPHPERIVEDKVLLKEMGQLPSFVRASELLRTNLRREASAEWQYGFDALAADKRPQMIHLAASWGWYDQAVATATQLRVFNDYALLYPRPYDREVRVAAKLTDVDADLIYGVMRQESLYRADAVSSANAYGLLQLILPTARSTAQRWQRPRPSASDLLVPSTSVTLGAGQLRMLLDRFGGQTAVALAGYNAGPSAATRWLPRESIDPDIWIENIPYNETRTYVQRVLWHTIVFGWLRSGDGQRTDGWLARIVAPDDPTRVGTL